MASTPIHLHPRGLLIAFEGIDGSGKTTQVQRLRASLESIGLQVVCTKEPTAGEHGAALRASAFTGRLSPEKELQLFVADRKEHLERVILPALAEGAVVLVDRYYLSTVAYQGARGLDPEFVLDVNEQFARIPDRIFLMVASVETGLQRIRKRGDIPNEFERAEQLEAVAGIFAGIGRAYISRVDAELDVDQVARAILQDVVEGLLFELLCEHRIDGRRCNAFACAQPCTYHRAAALLAQESPAAGAVHALLKQGETDPTVLREALWRAARES